MKGYFKYKLAILCVIAFTRVNGQVYPRYIFGVNLSTYEMNIKGLTSGPRMPAGIHFGGSIELPVTPRLTFEPALLFSAKGSSYKIDTVAIALSPIYIEIPLNMVYTIGSAPSRIFILAGPYLSYGIGGYKLETGKVLRYVNFGSGENKDLRAFDLGFNFGMGINIRGFIISASYGMGLTNIAPVRSDGSEIKNQVIGISISSLFAKQSQE
jgi:hypothetical protein